MFTEYACTRIWLNDLDTKVHSTWCGSIQRNIFMFCPAWYIVFQQSFLHLLHDIHFGGSRLCFENKVCMYLVLWWWPWHTGTFRAGWVSMRKIMIRRSGCWECRPKAASVVCVWAVGKPRTRFLIVRRIGLHAFGAWSSGTHKWYIGIWQGEFPIGFVWSFMSVEWWPVSVQYHHHYRQ